MSTNVSASHVLSARNDHNVPPTYSRTNMDHVKAKPRPDNFPIDGERCSLPGVCTRVNYCFFQDVAF